MRAIVITEPGGPEVLSWAEVPDPVPGPGEVVIDIAAAGVNRADLMQRQGFYPPPPGAPPYPRAASGLRPDRRAWRRGHRLAAGGRGVRPTRRRWLRGAGGRAAGPAAARSPDGVSGSAARRGLPEAACTIPGTVYQQAHLDAGEVYLVHGGAGGMGSFAIQLGKGGRRGGGLHRGHPGQAGDGAASSAPTWSSCLPRPGFRGHHPGLHRRARGRTSSWTWWVARTWPGTWPRWPPGAGWW